VDLPDGAVCDVLYEDLVSDPIGQVLRIYDQLELGALEPARKDLEKYVESQRDFKGNRYELGDEDRLLLNERWGRFFEPYGYELEVKG
jgi:hypothetical protein